MQTTTDCPIAITPRRSIGGIYPQIVIDEQHTDSLQITDDPVESGSSINDHAFKKPETVTITAGTSATTESIRTVYAKLLELQEKREPFEIVTGKRLYRDMLVETLTVPTDKQSENVLVFTAVCKQIRIVGLKTTTLPPMEKHKEPDKTGTPIEKGDVTPVEVQNKSSALGIIETWLGK